MSPRLLNLLYGLGARSWAVDVPGDPAAVEQRVHAAMSPPTRRWLSSFEWGQSAQWRKDRRGRDYVRLSLFGGWGNLQGLHDRPYLTFSTSAVGGTSVNVTQRCTPFVVGYFGAWLTAAWLSAVALLVIGIVRLQPVGFAGFVLPVFARIGIVDFARRRDARAVRRWLGRVLS
jgi:hypothetical protein